MSQARKGTATLFRPDRHFVSSGYQPTLIVDVALDLLEEASVPTPPMAFTAPLCIGSESQLVESNEYNILSNIIPLVSYFNMHSLEVYFLLALYHSFLLEAKTIPISDKGTGLAYKGTNILDRISHRWAALQAIPSTLVAEANLALESDVVFPSIHLILEAPLRLFSFQMSHSILTLALWQYLSNELAAKFMECINSAIKFSLAAPEELSDAYSIFLSQNISYHLINKLSASSPLFLLAYYPSLLHLEENLTLLLYSHFIVETPGEKVYTSFLSLESDFSQDTTDIYNLNLNFFLSPFFIKLYLFISFLYHLSSTVRALGMTVWVPQAFSKQACLSSSFIEDLKLALLFYPFSVFSFLWTRHLVLESILQTGGLKSLIGMILMELSTTSAFTKSSEFTAELLAYLTSNMPPAKPSLPYGKILFTDITRIYKYLMDLQQYAFLLSFLG